MAEWWLSWADAEGFNGAAIVDAEDFLEAVTVAIKLKIRPIKGGQVVGIPHEHGTFPEDHKNKLLTKNEAIKFTEELGEPKERG